MANVSSPNTPGRARNDIDHVTITPIFKTIIALMVSMTAVFVTMIATFAFMTAIFVSITAIRKPQFEIMKPL